MKRYLSVLFLFCFLIGAAHAQLTNINSYVTRNWISTDGLPGNSISDIVQLQDGYIYLGTYECLVKFDGFEFNTINKYTNPDYSFISARTIFEDSSGNFWIGSNDEGIHKVSSSGVETFDTKKGLPNNSIRDFAEDKYHNIWVGTAAGVVYITQGGSVRLPSDIEDVNVEHVLVKQLFCDTADRVWMLTSDIKGLYVLAGNSFQRYKELDAFGEYVPTAIGQDSNGDIWIGLNQDGIVKISNGKITRIKSETILDSSTINVIFCDSFGALWFGTEQGLVLYKDGVFSVSEDNESLTTSINQIIEDREGNIWIATDNSGICKVSPGKFRMKKLRHPVNAICEDPKGQVWIGTDNGLECYVDEMPVQNQLTEFCKGIRIRHIGLTKTGDLLVNCYRKPAQILYNGKKIISWSTDEGIVGNKTRVSIEARNGDLYIGTTTGLSVVKKNGAIHNYSIDNDLDCEYIMCLYEDDEGLIWIGTDGGGIYIMKDEKIIKKFSTEQGFAGNVIFKIMQDTKGIFWICTGSGISRYEKKHANFESNDISKNIFNFTTGTGLGSDSIFQMLIDDSNTVWMVSIRGIASVPYEDMEAVVEGELAKIDCKFYTQSDGLKSIGANSTALSMIDRYDRVWFTMADGFAIYDPLRAKTNVVLPIVQIEYVWIDDKEITDFSKPIVIQPGAKHVDIKYTGLSFTSTERNRFVHKMEGFDNAYSEPSTQRKVSYTNLKPGKYTFFVNVQNSEGVYSDSPGMVQFIQKPFYYQMYRFWIIVGVLFALALVFSFYHVSRINKKRQLVLETKIQMATVELQMAKDDSDRLLKNILPVSIAERMKGLDGEKTIADTYENVTVLFSDIVGFTKKTGNATAEEIVSSLNELFSRFDKRAAGMGVEKIKTIGDAYMAACGVPVPNSKHAIIMVKFAMGMFKDLAEYNKTAKIKFNIRIGLNSGKVVAGVIGRNKFIYDIWGDTVNVASRMESNCSPGHIKFTESVQKCLLEHHISLKCREEMCDVKGKGLMKTFQIPE